MPDITKVSPECRNGKHKNCDGNANNHTPRFVQCMCSCHSRIK